MANRKNTFLLKRSNVVNKVPSLGDIQLGEIALNTADAKLFSTYTGGLTGATEIREIGWDRLSTISGGTVNGDVIINADLTVTGDTQLVNVSGTSFYTDYIDFNNTLSPVPTDIEGRIYWDDDNGSVSLGMHGGQVIQQIGLEHYYYIKNQSGATIDNGRVVRAAGTLGSSSRILGEYMIADNTIPPNLTLGIASENIIDGDDGYVTEFGLVRNINTTGSLYGETWSDGTILYVSPTIPGGLTSVEPIAPDLKIEMAIVINAAPNGSIFVRPNRYPHIYDLQQVNYSAGTENNLDILQWNDSNQTWDKTNTPSFSGLTVNNNINHLGNYILDGNISQTGDYSVTGDTSINGNLDVTGTVNIGTLGTGTSINTLGIDSNGYVVSATTKDTIEIMYFNTNTSPLADNTSYLFTVNTSLSAGSIANTPGMPLPIGTIVGWRLTTYNASTIGSNETGTLKLLWDDGTSDVTLSNTITWDGNRTAVFSGTLSQAITSVFPSWAFINTPTFVTNPTAVKMILILQMEI
jgi:hypothetical protein